MIDSWRVGKILALVLMFNILWKGTNPTILSPAMGKNDGRQFFFILDMASSLKEGKA